MILSIKATVEFLDKLANEDAGTTKLTGHLSTKPIEKRLD